jgi:beta-galactosidase/beta-glucuronidase
MNTEKHYLFGSYRLLMLAAFTVFVGSQTNSSLAESAIPRPEHPRPQFKRDTWINLNGQCRTFTLPTTWKDRRVFLHFGAVDYECHAWVNRRPVGRHYGGSVSFAFEITDAIKKGENELVVYAFDDVRSDIQPEKRR